jgi:sucrose-phosphate synthase
MHIAFLNPQGNFDSRDSYWTEHPDFGGQLVYVKQLALALAKLGHQVDILTRQIIDPDWPEFAGDLDAYLESENVRIVRLLAGPRKFLRKELLWPYLMREWVPNILSFYGEAFPEAFTAHYGDGGLCGAFLKEQIGVPFTFTAHSLGAQKMDKLHVTLENLAEMDSRLHFGSRLMAERLAMNCSAVNITSTRQERFEQYAHRAYRGAVDVEDEQRFAMIPPGVNLAVFGAGVHSADEKRVQTHVQDCLYRDITEGRRGLPVIVASSRLDPKKNHVGLVQAFAQSSALQKMANLVIITGALDDPLHENVEVNPTERGVIAEIRETIEKHNLWGKVSAFALRGQSALAAAYRFFAGRHSIFALTALYEPFGLAPLEAAAAGLPVVVTQNGGPSESFRDAEVEYGVLVDPTDPADIKRGLRRLLGDAASWGAFAERGRQHVLNHYTWERTAHGYLVEIQKSLAMPAEQHLTTLLPIPPFFRDPTPENAISTEELAAIYLEHS